MTSETYFLNPTASVNSTVNFATATGDTLFSNYSQAASAASTQTQTQTLVNGGLAAAFADAKATAGFGNDANFSYLFSDSAGIGVGDTFSGSAQSNTKVVANFDIAANQNFSFKFSTNLALTAKEIENSKTEYNHAESKSTFLVLDTSNPNRPKILDYFGVRGNLISSQDIGDLKFLSSGNVNIATRRSSTDIEGNNGVDFVSGIADGTYQRRFGYATKISVVEVNASAVEFYTDNLIGNLGSGVTYGTLFNDNLYGSNGADKIYGSLGNDRIEGNNGNDILEGGQGNDSLYGGDGDDKLSGGLGNDVLVGGRGNDVLVGGGGSDTFVFQALDSFFSSDYNVIKDFEVGVDKVKYLGINLINQMNDTQSGALVTVNLFTKILFEGVSVSELKASNFEFS